MATQAPGKRLSAFAVYNSKQQEPSGSYPATETATSSSKASFNEIETVPNKRKKRKLSQDERFVEERSNQKKKSNTKKSRVAKLKRMMKTKAKRSKCTLKYTEPLPEVELETTSSQSETPTKFATEAVCEPLNHQESNNSIAMKADVTDKPFYDQFNPEKYSDSRVAAQELFKLLIYPLSVEQFYADVWEKKPLLLRRHQSQYNGGWFSTTQLDSILRTHSLEFTTNVDITSYVDGVKEVHNPSGQAHASVVWEYFNDGCSVRLLNPQSYSKSMWLLNSTLQEHFRSMVGANVYLTPPGSQGFAPHYDDIEAFVLQLEGKKHWRLYPPRSSNEVLPRYSSPNFSKDDIGEPILDAVLEPGDLLYFPRGIIHQASTPPDSHSLHITVSTYQNNSWGALLEKLLPAALQTAISEDVDFRCGLPPFYLNYTGIVNSDSDDPRRVTFAETVANLMSKLIQYAPIDAATDQMGVDHIHDCLPPCLNQKEEQASMVGNGAKWEDGEVKEGVELTPDTKVKLIRHGIVRLVLEGDQPILYYTLQNSRVYHEKDPLGIEILSRDAAAVDNLINSYPEFVAISSLPSERGSLDDNVELCTTLYNQGLLQLKF